MRHDAETPDADASLPPPPSPSATRTPPTDCFDTLFTPVKELIEQSPDKFQLPYCDFLQFLRAVKCNNKPYEVARTFTDDVPTLIDLLTFSLPHLKKSGERALKARIDRLARSLSKTAAYLDSSGEEYSQLSHTLSVESLVD